MSFSLVLLQQLIGNGVTRTIRKTITASGNPRVSEAVASPAVGDLLINIDYSAMTMLWISSDQPVSLAPKDSGGSSAGEAIAVDSDAGYVWTSDSGLDNPFTADVAKFTPTNASGSSANVVIEVLVDATP